MTAPTPPFKTHFAEQRETYQAALMSLFSGKPEDTEADLEKLFTPDFTQRDDETTRDFDGWVRHVRWLRETLPNGSLNLTVNPFLRDGPHLAERHNVDHRYRRRIKDGRGDLPVL